MYGVNPQEFRMLCWPRHRWRHVFVTLGVMVFTVSGCAHWTQQRNRYSKAATELKVVPFSTRHAIALAAPDVVNIMRAANFTDQQIYELGTQVRDALMTVGGVQIQVTSNNKTKVAVQFVINEEDYVLVTSMASGYFVYDVRNHRLGFRPPAQQQHPPTPTPIQ